MAIEHEIAMEHDMLHVNNITEEEVAIVIVAATTATISTLLRRRHHRRRQHSSKRRLPQPRYARAALVHPLHGEATTPWKQLISCGTSKDFLQSVNVDREVFFHKLLPAFGSVRGQVQFGSPYRRSIKLRGRKPLLGTVDILGLALWYIKSSSRIYALCTTFGIVPSSIYVWVDYGMEVLYQLCRRNVVPEMKVTWPTRLEMVRSSELLSCHRGYNDVLKGVFAIMDGGRLPCADYCDPDTQNAYYEGYTTNIEVTNLLVFDFFGQIIHAGVNFPGSWHDARVAIQSGLYYPKLSNEFTPNGFAILCDSAFTVDAKSTDGKIVRAKKTNETKELCSSWELSAVELVLQRIYPSERQSAEWGIRALKAPFGRLRLPLSADSKSRCRLLTVCVHLLNLRTRCVGLNQIRTTYGGNETDCNPWVQRHEAEQNVDSHLHAER